MCILILSDIPRKNHIDDGLTPIPTMKTMPINGPNFATVLCVMLAWLPMDDVAGNCNICLTKTRRMPDFLAFSLRSSPRHHHQSHEGGIALESLGDRRCIKAYPSLDPTPSTGSVGWPNQQLPDVTSMALFSFRSGTTLISL